MPFFFKSRHVAQVVLALLVISGLLGIWQGTLFPLPLPDFIPTLARAIPADALAATCAVTAIALAAYPTVQVWERTAPRGVLLHSYLLAFGLGLLTSLTFGLACFGGSGTWPVLLKLLGLLGCVSVLYRPLGSGVSLLPAAFLLLTTVFARQPGGGFAPWAWLMSPNPNLFQVLATCALAALAGLLLKRWGLVSGRR